ATVDRPRVSSSCFSDLKAKPRLVADHIRPGKWSPLLRPKDYYIFSSTLMKSPQTIEESKIRGAHDVFRIGLGRCFCDKRRRQRHLYLRPFKLIFQRPAFSNDHRPRNGM